MNDLDNLKITIIPSKQSGEMKTRVGGMFTDSINNVGYSAFTNFSFLPLISTKSGEN